MARPCHHLASPWFGSQDTISTMSAEKQSTFIIEILTHMLAEGPSRDLLRALVKSRDDSSSNST